MKEKRQCSYMTIDILSKYLERMHSHIIYVWILYFGNAFAKCILKNVFFRMHFDKNSTFGKILKLFIRSNYA